MSPSAPRHALRVLSAALLPLLAPAAVAQFGPALDVLPSSFPAASVRGEAAIERLGEGLVQLAEASHMSADELRSSLLNDETLWLSGEGRLFFVDPLPLVPAEVPSELPGSYSGGETIPTSEAFNLASNPGANKTIYLDFTGHHSVNNAWGHNIVFPAYNTSGTPGSFSNGELLQIIEWWQRVVEDYSSFDANVTTIEPPISDLTKNGGSDQRYGMRCVITQPTSGFGNGIGGVAYLNSFNDSNDNPCFNFNKGNNTGSMTVSHESGHTFGLSHDGLNGSSYHPGSGSGETSWGPIMGAPFGSNLVQWSNGDYAGATTGQNDVGIITNSSNGVDFVADDHGDDRFSASPVSDPVGCPVPTPGFAEGTIERRNDVDAFEFTTSGGAVTISAVPFSPGGNLDIELTIQDSSGATVATVNDANQADAIAALSLSAGTYYALVDGIDKPGSYSDYGCIGRYDLYVSAAGQESYVDLGNALGNSFGLTPTFSVSGVLCEGNEISYQMGLAAGSSPAFLILGFSELNLPFKGGVLVPDPGPPGSITAFTTNFLGGVSFSAPWPAGVPGGVELVMQYWIQDALGPAGFTASNGVKVISP